MKRKIPCLCENTFTMEIPEEINLDKDPKYLEEIENGSFMNFNCPDCGKLHKPEFPLIVLWPGKNLRLEVIPEQERMGFYHRKDEKEKGDKTEVIIGYIELADRLAVIRDGLEPAVIESLKYYLYLKAGETNPENEVNIWYHGKTTDAADAPPDTIKAALEFHIQGLKENSMALTRLPFSLYEKTAEDYKKHPRGELFVSLRHKNYLSVQNMMLPGNLK
ncbi:MAG: CpXC domain-containing protein [Spirochaetaceae bacterium]|nr:CpXC domain-containing protein [Spirochaetaceae bacterium]